MIKLPKGVGQWNLPGLSFNGDGCMNPFSILMWLFAAALLLYALILALTKDVGLIPRTGAVKIDDGKAYATTFAKAIAVVALAPLGSGIYGLFSTAFGMVMLFVNFVLCIWIAMRFFRRPPT